MEKLREYIEKVYIALMKQGYKLGEIDSMDVFYYMYLLDSIGGKEDKDKEIVYIDQVSWW